MLCLGSSSFDQAHCGFKFSYIIKCGLVNASDCCSGHYFIPHSSPGTPRWKDLSKLMALSASYNGITQKTDLSFVSCFKKSIYDDDCDDHGDHDDDGGGCGGDDDIGGGCGGGGGDDIIGGGCGGGDEDNGGGCGCDSRHPSFPDSSDPSNISHGIKTETGENCRRTHGIKTETAENSRRTHDIMTETGENCRRTHGLKAETGENCRRTHCIKAETGENCRRTHGIKTETGKNCRKKCLPSLQHLDYGQHRRSRLPGLAWFFASLDFLEMRQNLER
ncbi:hypothetical protein ElyMa_003156700 [Elysia marginata]|uniref:Uncharacterized protein n=1 Tax=Elysia marginata TaxID=1093978 RepID=A0AAV4IW47_9GAST|nr:hypothetical protein ElyMa_003156700 [Elysia marginata]